MNMKSNIDPFLCYSMLMILKLFYVTICPILLTRWHSITDWRPCSAWLQLQPVYGKSWHPWKIDSRRILAAVLKISTNDFKYHQKCLWRENIANKNEVLLCHDILRYMLIYTHNQRQWKHVSRYVKLTEQQLFEQDLKKRNGLTPRRKLVHTRYQTLQGQLVAKTGTPHKEYPSY